MTTKSQTLVPQKVATPTKRATVLQKLQQSWQLYALLLIPLVYLIVFKYVPMYGAQIAFRNFSPIKGLWESDWVGFTNFMRFFNSHLFWRIIWNTLALSVYALVAGFPFPIILALSLNQVRQQFFKKTVQMVTYAPHFISVVVMVGMLLQVLDPRVGIINLIIQSFGFEPINFMGKPGYFRSIYVWSHIWQHTGFGCIIYLAVLSTIDPALHEAAVVDGANKLQRMWYIDIPGIIPVAIVLLILNTGNMLDIGFEKVLLMQNPLNMSTSEVIDTYVYRVGLASQVLNFSYATAIGLFKSVINLILLVAINTFARRTVQQSLW
ncbi:MAG: ABC transporter permease subunit [Chloroflexota bacterium]